MKAISLFSGCGGCDFGLEQAGVEVIYANEIMEDACKTLKRYFKNTDVDNRDIKLVKAFPKASLVCGGYPCQSFSMGGNRNPEKDDRTNLFREFARCISEVNPKFFIAENVSGLKKLEGGRFLEEQMRVFKSCGEKGYNVSAQILDARQFGVPQNRKRILLVGVRADIKKAFIFPEATHGAPGSGLLPFASHGEAIKDLPLWPEGEFYERPHDPAGNWSWYFMSRNRKAPWDGPAYTVVANWRHVTVHPGSPTMKLTWSDLKNGFKQRWDFSDEYEHLSVNPKRPFLKSPRRLSWRECARIQGFPKGFTPHGDVESKFEQIGNAVPPELFRVVAEHLVSGKGLVPLKAIGERSVKSEQLWINYG